MAFIIWSLFGCFLVGLGIYCRHTNRLMYFWANDREIVVSDQKAYNQALGNCWIIYGCLFIGLGLPMLCESKLFGLFSIFASFFWVIALMLSYLRISDRYRCN